eukprot:Sspe_Gene.60812::Locus_33582_Transcript_4_4_Confidence_0.667_Length_379::g.60812::m.60812
MERACLFDLLRSLMVGMCSPCIMFHKFLKQTLRITRFSLLPRTFSFSPPPPFSIGAGFRLGVPFRRVSNDVVEVSSEVIQHVIKLFSETGLSGLGPRPPLPLE